jgi:hypothetical protein
MHPSQWKAVANKLPRITRLSISNLNVTKNKRRRSAIKQDDQIVSIQPARRETEVALFRLEEVAICVVRVDVELGKVPGIVTPQVDGIYCVVRLYITSGEIHSVQYPGSAHGCDQRGACVRST